MAIIRPFKGIRPKKELVEKIASKPYDVLNEKEARAEAAGNNLSFYHVIKPEIDFPDGYNVYAPEIYTKGKSNFDRMVQDGVFFKDKTDCLYIYAQTMKGRRQFGIVAAAAVDDYFNDIIKKHELTRPDKEEDRKNHVRVSKLNYEPVFFAYPNVPALDKIVAGVVQAPAEYDFTADDGIRHEFWVISDGATVNQMVDLFAGIPATYVADGHHRTAAAALVGQELRKAKPDYSGKESFNFFLAVHFPDNQLAIMDYNRVVKDLNGLSNEQFLDSLRKSFLVETVGAAAYRPARLHEFSMYLDGQWYKLTAKTGTYDDADPIGVLDVTVLSKQILEPILGIQDLRTDKRIDFVGGLRGLGELERRVNSGEMKVAFALYPVTMKQLIDISDSGKIMPPKTTWFEPKLRSGLILHSLED
ncbi:MAG: DUF1015 domain-containing protein [Bacteroidota bacterium]|jgi:uncharacterized protein (DUF1015 family)|uniref:DUF1015 domain-containing protein n=1 Tax=Candidatus Pollutiaquabacter sp. TaxID=3416354 RepID=UPI001A5DCACC|nr:DUF1015 domain-containing protein [Bacteroidota bacterium]MBL7948148.1 DUF1015 domain-containing protein [Bacteroidia bacterium]MBP6010039.1 DUF1015 domain-containing protein [Bacteroidia bacterium]MBP7269901.1 DUF1015 domain-containing protein [Bacteroidia bacterium]MBP7436916.1 DUF1015 domain-containing protein [Bacteroidia bacterium]